MKNQNKDMITMRDKKGRAISLKGLADAGLAVDPEKPLEEWYDQEVLDKQLLKNRDIISMSMTEVYNKIYSEYRKSLRSIDLSLRFLVSALTSNKFLTLIENLENNHNKKNINKIKVFFKRKKIKIYKMYVGDQSGLNGYQYIVLKKGKLEGVLFSEGECKSNVTKSIVTTFPNDENDSQKNP